MTRAINNPSQSHSKMRSLLNWRVILCAPTVALLWITTPIFAQNQYHLEAKRLAKIAHPKAQQAVIAKTLKIIDQELPKSGLKGFTRTDVIALILGESGFWHRDRGGVGEAGLWQVRPEYFPKGADPYQIVLNTRYGLKVLRSKQKRWKDRKRTIIAYNGLWRHSDGKVDERYWRWFKHNRKRVELTLAPIYRDSRRIHNTPKFPVPILASKPKPKRITFNQELARQLENDVYGKREG